MGNGYHHIRRLSCWLITAVLLCLFFVDRALANSPEITLTESTEPISVRDFAYLLDDSEEQFEFTDILVQLQHGGGIQDNPNWTKASSGRSVLGVGEKIWIAFSIHNSNATAVNWLLHIDYSMVSDMGFFLVRENDEVEAYRIGTRYAFAQRPILHPRPLVPIALAADEKVWMVMSNSSLNSYVVRRSQLFDELSFWQQQHKRPLFQMFFNGAAAILLILIALGYLFSRDVSYIFLELLLLCHVTISIAHHGVLIEYLWPHPISAWTDIRIALDFFTCASIILFADFFLNLTFRQPSVSQLFRPLGYGLLVAGCLYPLFITSPVIDDLFLVVLVVGRVPLLLLVLSLALLLWAKGSVAARNFFWVWLVYVSAYSVMILALLLEDAQFVERAGLVWDVGTLVVSLALVIMLAQKVASYRERAIAARAESRSKSEFLARMSHEIRTPLTGIIGMSEVLQKNLTDKQNQNYAEVIKNSGVTLLSIINEILDFSKIAANKMQIECVDLELAKLVDNIRGMFYLRAKEAGVDFVVCISPELPEVIKGDPTRLSQVIINLLSNAFKFTQQGQIRLEIAMDENRPEYFRVAVSDAGIGIAESAVKTIFDSFTQAETSTTRSYGGTGLGLAICKNLTELMGGEISVSSIEGEGSCFSFSLPLRKGTKKIEQDNSGLATRKEVAARCLDILVAEDNQVNCLVIETMLKSLGHTVTLCGDGKQALVKLTEKSYDLILMDCEMPNMDGYEATIRWRKIEGESDKKCTPVVALTAHASMAHRDKCIASGMDGYVAKPFTRASMTEGIAAVFKPA